MGQLADVPAGAAGETRDIANIQKPGHIACSGW